MRDFLNDIRVGARLLVKSPGYTAVVVLTLALAIGANTIIFSFTEVLLLRPLPLGDPARTVFLYTADRHSGVNRGGTSLPDFLDWKAQASSFDDMGASSRAAFTLTGSGEPVRISARKATSNLFGIWELNAVAGRTFRAGEDAPGAAKTIVLSHRFWAEHFGSDPAVLDKTLLLDGEPYTVIGVLTPSIEVGNFSEIDLWVPQTIDPAARRDDRALQVVARLKAGQPFDAARAEMATIGKRLADSYPQTNADRAAYVLKMRDAIVGNDTWMILALLMIVVGFVLLIACANVANMMLARATSRAREMAVRVALGATRWRLVSQMVTESLLLGIGGGLLGVALAKGGLVGIAAQVQEQFFHMLRLNGHVLAFAFGLSVITPVVFATLPALQTSRADVNETLKEGGRRAAGGRKGRRSRAVLVVSQLALAVILLIVAGLVVRTMSAMRAAPLGIDPKGVLTADMQLDGPAHRDIASLPAFTDRLLERVSNLPDVRATAITDRLPALQPEPTVSFQIEGKPVAEAKDRPWANAVNVGGDFFGVFGIRQIAGRVFTPHDTSGSVEVCVISRNAADRYWSGASPVGAHIMLAEDGGSPRRVQVVGVVDDVKGPDVTEPAPPRVYRPFAQHPERGIAVALRAGGDPGAAAPSVRAAIRSADPDLALSQIRTVQSALDQDFQSNVLLVEMFIAFAIVALLLAGAGLYGVTSYSVSQRSQEIGIRMALGASGGDIIGMIFRQNAVLIGSGAIIGVAGGAALGRAMRSILYSVTPGDPATLGIVVAVLGLVALVASYVPALRASRVQPLDSLRID